MKKIFTMVMLCIFTVMSAQADETTLWEGDYNVDWDLPEGNANREWKELGQADFAAFEEGQKLYFYFTIVGTDYHKYNFDNWSWEALPGHENEHDATFGISADTKVEFVVTKEIKTAIAANGFTIHGHGFHVVKVTTGTDAEEINDLDAALLWGGEATIDGWGGKVLVLTEESDGFSVFTEKLTKACNLYFLIEDATGGDFRISGQWGAWDATAYPSDGYNHMKTLDADNVVKVSLDETFVTKAFKEKGGIAFWGNGGFKIKAIATTKAALTGTDGITNVNLNDNVNMNANAPIFNLAGQRVSKNYKGVVIVNGKKYLNK